MPSVPNRNGFTHRAGRGGDCPIAPDRWEADPSERGHPAAPLVSAWYRRTTDREARRLRIRASLPRFGKMGTDDACLPGFPEGGPPAPAHGQLLLPGFDDAVPGCTSWLLWLFDQAGGKSMASGPAARLGTCACLCSHCCTSTLPTAMVNGTQSACRRPRSTPTGSTKPPGSACYRSRIGCTRTVRRTGSGGAVWCPSTTLGVRGV